ncbi:MAG: PTS sugar transporter subunit IIA [Candidatus Hydrogenedentales bacterium]|jgi:PTS system nitrogen regulatory IIA component
MMNTILDALQEGRLFELPDNDKTDALQFLAHIIEAFPEIPASTDVYGHVMEREEMTNTALGKGWACPHARLPFDENIMCVIGWSPTGIDYGAPDGLPVSMVIMYLVPENQRNQYLREISLLAKAVQNYPGLEQFRQAEDLDSIRNYLLDLIDATKASVSTDTRARMIRLQAKVVPDGPAFQDLSNLVVEPITLVSGVSGNPVVLTQNPEFLDQFSANREIADKINTDGMYQNGGWRIMRRNSTAYQGGMMAHECIAVKLIPQ